MAAAQVYITSRSSQSQEAPVGFEINLDQFRDPMGNKYLLANCRNGKDQLVRDWLKGDPRYKSILTACKILVADHFKPLAPGSGWLTITFRDYHGKWKSMGMAELVADELSPMINVTVHHGTFV